MDDRNGLTSAAKKILGWATPTARDSKGSDAPNRGGAPSLPEMVKMSKEEPCRERERVQSGWPTPTAVDRVRDDETMAKCAAFRKKNAGQKTVPLYLGETAKTALGTTPTSSPAPTAPPAELDAAFSLWLQGYHPEWNLSSPNYSDWATVQQMLSDSNGKPENFWRELARTVSSDSRAAETRSSRSSARSSSSRAKKRGLKR